MKQTTCKICNKKETVGMNKPHSQHRTKRVIFPNIQKISGEYLCTRCARTRIKKGSL